MSPRAGGRGNKRRLGAIAAGLLLFAGFSGLGAWQLQRLAWKQDLIARVDVRAHTPPAPAPGPARWPAITAQAYEYRHVQVSGTFENDRETLVQAVTEAGPGFWVMTPLKTDAGFTVLVNRGFAPTEFAAQAARRAGLVAGHATVTGLLRISEPHGAFLRANQPTAGRWYSRDVAAIARARDVSQAAPYFLDADGAPNSGGWPRGGMTVIHFRNSHLSYALTWFGLALMVALWGAWPLVESVRARRLGSGADLAPTHGSHG